MSALNVKIIVRKTVSDIGIMDISGEITGAAEEVLSDAYNQIGTSARAIILNFTAMEYMYSSGIGLLVTLLIRAKRHGQRLTAFGLSEHYQEIFELTRLNEVIVLYASEEEAFTALKAEA